MSLGSNPDLRDIFQNSSSARNVGDLGTNNYVWDTNNNINVCFGLFEKASQSPVTSGIISVLTLRSVLITIAKSIYLLIFSLSLLIIL